MSDNLTIAELNRVISLMPEFPDIVGYKVNPGDLRDLAEQLEVSYAEATRYVLPYYGGLSLYPDVSIPRGCLEPVRFEKS